jgi:hypothetical protein
MGVPSCVSTHGLLVCSAGVSVYTHGKHIDGVVSNEDLEFPVVVAP